MEPYSDWRGGAPDVAISSAMAIRSLLSVGKVDLAESVVEEGLRKLPGFRALEELHGEVACRRRNWSEMARRYRLVRRKFPDAFQYYVLEAAALRALGQFDEADKLLEHAIAIAPRNPAPAAEYALVADRRGAPEEALRRWELMRKRVEDYVKDDAVWVEPARIMCRMGREDEAIELLTRARWRFPGRPGLMVELAHISHRRGPPEEAVRQWQEVRKLFPHNEHGYIGGARALRELGRQEEAEALLQTYADRRDPSAGGMLE
jgi:predicted Zn-dependent protease